jgi:hypothetical protein
MKRIISLALLFMIVAFAFCSCGNNDDIAEEVRIYRENKFKIYREENEKYSDYEVDVAFLGDSLTDQYDVTNYYPNFLVSNRGIGGDTTFTLEERLQVSVYDLKPKVVVMLIGGNNINTMFDNYERILKGLEENLPNTNVVLLSLTSMSGEIWGANNKLAAYNNAKIKLYAEKYDFEFVDLYTPLMNLETGGIYDEYTTDGGHLTDKGYEVLTRCITPVVTEQIALWTIKNNVE